MSIERGNDWPATVYAFSSFRASETKATTFTAVDIFNLFLFLLSFMINPGVLSDVDCCRLSGFFPDKRRKRNIQ